MTREELLLSQLAEECCEVGKLVSKSQRFGLDSKNLKKNKTNRELLSLELIDIFSVHKKLLDEGTLEDLSSEVTHQLMILKQNKIERYLRYSRDCGQLC